MKKIHYLFLGMLLLQLLKVTTGLSQPGSITLGDKNAIVYALDLLSNKKIVAASLGDKIELWNYSTKTLARSWPAPKILAIRSHDQRLAGVSKSGEFFIWDSSSGNELIKIKLSDSPLICLAWIDSVSIVAGSDSGEIIVYNIPSRKIQMNLTNNSPVTAIACTTDGVLMVSGDAKGIISVWKTADGKSVFKTRGHRRWIRDLKFLMNNKKLVSVGDDGFMKRWSLAPGTLLGDRQFEGNWALCVDYFKGDTKTSEVIAVGLRNGGVSIQTDFGTYHLKGKAMVNSIVLLTEELPKIQFVLGTHGDGIRLGSGKDMKLK